MKRRDDTYTTPIKQAVRYGPGRTRLALTNRLLDHDVPYIGKWRWDVFCEKVTHTLKLSSSNGTYHHMCEPPPLLYDTNSLFVSWHAE